MKIAIVAATGALLVLAACNGADDGTNTAAAAEAANAAEAAPAAEAAAGGKDPAAGAAEPQAAGAPATSSARAGSPPPAGAMRELLLGRWTDSGDCARATEFRANGTFTSPRGEGRWTLSEMGYLDLTGAGPAIETSVQEIDRRAMTTYAPGGGITEWTRC